MKKVFIIKKSSDLQFYFVEMSANGNVITTSETYTRKSSAKSAIIGKIKRLLKLFNVADLVDWRSKLDHLILDETHLITKKKK